MMVLGLATAPIFPLLTLTTSDRVGLVIGAVSAWTLAPALLILSLAMCGVYWLTLRTVV